jgi:hypothetical protein
LLSTQLRTGDCLTGSNLGLGTSNPWPELSTAVPCSRPHLAEVFFADNAYWSASYPGDTLITQEADAKRSEAYLAYVGIPDSRSIYNWDNVFPDATDWSHGNRELVCVAFHPTSSAIGHADLRIRQRIPALAKDALSGVGERPTRGVPAARHPP